MSETVILKDILVALPRDGLWYRRNTGAARDARTGRLVRFGLPGMADIGGIYRGRAVEIEVKTEKGKQSQPQRNWQAAVERAGGIYILARSVNDVMDVLERIPNAYRL